MSANGDMIIALDKERMQAMADKDIAKLKTFFAKTSSTPIPRHVSIPKRASFRAWS